MVALALASVCGAGEGPGPQAAISQYGITWAFAEPARVGRYVTGDWWVVGPVTVKGVTPAPFEGRNGSVVNPPAGKRQGYDDRISGYDASLRAAFPLALKPGQSLVSTASVDLEPRCLLRLRGPLGERGPGRRGGPEDDEADGLPALLRRRRRLHRGHQVAGLRIPFDDVSRVMIAGRLADEHGGVLVLATTRAMAIEEVAGLSGGRRREPIEGFKTAQVPGGGKWKR